MSSRLSEPIVPLAPILRRERGTKYPYDQWTDGAVWLAVEGEDFTVSRESFRSALAQHAAKNGLDLLVGTSVPGVPGRPGKVGVQFQFVRPNEAAA